jgi:hypothetical protein
MSTPIRTRNAQATDTVYRAQWWTRAGFRTNGTFVAPSAADVQAVIERSGGTRAVITRAV